mmetsp:Transcript_142666/g.251875  ORF Transcript_142666/g.251875 Transcript_142666/m.251875 type:complete len:186 (-) Transcript_142666:96-653(-)
MAWSQGVFALLTLYVTTAGGLLLGFSCVPPTQWIGMPSIAPMMRHVITTFCVSVVFWIWALRNSWRDQFDLGAVTFGLVVVAAVLGCADGGVRGPGPARHRIMMPGACAAVCLNYAVGMVAVRGTWTMQFYLANGTAWWAAASVLGYIYANRSFKEHEVSKVQEQEMMATTFGADIEELQQLNQM